MGGRQGLRAHVCGRQVLLSMIVHCVPLNAGMAQKKACFITHLVVYAYRGPKACCGWCRALRCSKLHGHLARVLQPRARAPDPTLPGLHLQLQLSFWHTQKGLRPILFSLCSFPAQLAVRPACVLQHAEGSGTRASCLIVWHAHVQKCCSLNASAAACCGLSLPGVLLFVGFEAVWG
jgi:hypothetical protein